jgi:hypothetical protein
LQLSNSGCVKTLTGIYWSLTVDKYANSMYLKMVVSFKEEFYFMGQISSSAAQVIISIIPIVGIVMGSVVIFFYLLWNHKRRTLLIKAGQFKRPEFDLLTFSLLAGLLLSAVGLALTIFLAIALGVNFGLLGGIIPLAVGIGLLAYYGIRHGDRPS